MPDIIKFVETYPCCPQYSFCWGRSRPSSTWSSSHVFYSKFDHKLLTCQTAGQCTWWSPWRSRWCRWRPQSLACPPLSTSASLLSPRSPQCWSRSELFFSPWFWSWTTWKSETNHLSEAGGTARSVYRSVRKRLNEERNQSNYSHLIIKKQFQIIWHVSQNVTHFSTISQNVTSLSPVDQSRLSQSTLASNH